MIISAHSLFDLNRLKKMRLTVVLFDCDSNEHLFPLGYLLVCLDFCSVLCLVYRMILERNRNSFGCPRNVAMDGLEKNPFLSDECSLCRRKKTINFVKLF